MGNRIIIIDDEQDFLESIARGLFNAGYVDVRTESDPVKAAMFFEQGKTCDIALIDLSMPVMNGVELLEIIKNHSPNTECIMVTAVNDARMAVACLKKGAYDYLIKPVSREDLLLKIGHAEEKKRLLDILELKRTGGIQELTNVKAFERIITRSPGILAVLTEAELHAVSNVPVLITGESGTGKELLARAIHMASPRAQDPFIPVNMASLSSSLFDDDFFGHVRGAFTGAEKDHKGYLERANHGTLFLDEIGVLPMDLQGKLLRVLQEGEFTKLGTSRMQKVDARFVAATNENLDALLKRGKFRKDLYYRLKGAQLHLPPLRERPGDIPLLIDSFVADLSGVFKERRIEDKAVSMLTAYDFPGNIRELRSILHAAANLAQGRPIAPGHLPEPVRRQKQASGCASLPLGNAISLSENEKLYILNIYHQTAENKSQTARVLGISINTLRRKLESYAIE
ncbi:MAG: sigma-54-dependent Fis family transcriptional regulator [Deltaproteobacteria bacterium]|nr:sigma-54-dependent Fis family transcriptional regulator [Deltaproteobacteria bacterium]